ncbi:MAG: MGMT family protein, partial [Oscillospiraceae bacterium]|nr:MGMT family protein [Oscillospiraceae bacterium]
MEYRCRVASPLGEITLRSDGEALTGLRFDEAGPPEVSSEPEPPVFEQARRWLARFFAGLDPGPTPPLRPAGSDFQRAVWALLTEIPRGQTRSYGALAAALAGRGK